MTIKNFTQFTDILLNKKPDSPIKENIETMDKLIQQSSSLRDDSWDDNHQD